MWVWIISAAPKAMVGGALVYRVRVAFPLQGAALRGPPSPVGLARRRVQQVGADLGRGERLRRIQRIDPLHEGLEVAREIDQEGDRRVDDVPGRRGAVQQVLRELQLARHR